jgi:hypothetical protein
MERRTKVIIIVGVVVLFGIIVWLLRPKPTFEVEQDVSAGAQADVVERSGTIVAPPAPVAVELDVPEADTDELAVRQIVHTFAERFGSYSTEGQFVNILDLTPLVTERYRLRLADLIRSDGDAGIAAATTTRALTVDVELDDRDDPRDATASVLAQRLSTGSSARTQTLTLTLLKTSAGWRVDDATWKTDEPAP